MEDVFIFVEQQFRAHFVETLIITVSIGVLVVSLFALAIIRSNRQRAEQYPKPTSVAKFGPDMTQPHQLHDEIAKRDRDLEKWREEHKGQLWAWSLVALIRISRRGLQHCQLTDRKGVEGAKISDVAQFAPSLLRAVRAQKIVFAVSVNDAHRWRRVIPAGLPETLVAARESGGKIYVATSLPLGGWQFLTAIERLRLSIRGIQSLGATAISLDNSADTDGLLPEAMAADGLHLGPIGYEVWRATLAQGCKD